MVHLSLTLKFQQFCAGLFAHSPKTDHLPPLHCYYSLGCRQCHHRSHLRFLHHHCRSEGGYLERPHGLPVGQNGRRVYLQDLLMIALSGSTGKRTRGPF